MLTHRSCSFCTIVDHVYLFVLISKSVFIVICIRDLITDEPGRKLVLAKTKAGCLFNGKVKFVSCENKMSVLHVEFKLRFN